MNKRFTFVFSLAAILGCSLISSCNKGSNEKKGEPEITRTTFYFNSQNEKLFVGDTFKLEPDGYSSKSGLTWISSSPNIASVNEGLVTALSIGDAVISAYDDYSIAKCSISVIKHDENFYVTLSQDKIILNVDDTFTIVPTFQNNEGPIASVFTVTPFTDNANDFAAYELKDNKHIFTAKKSGECVYSFTTTYNNHSYGANLTISIN